MLNVRLYYEKKFWWFELVELSAGFPRRTTNVLYRRRYASLEEAQDCGEQAMRHELQKRKENQIFTHEAN